MKTLGQSCITGSRRMLAGLAVVGLCALTPTAAHACAACFGRSDSKMAQGMNMGIFTLLIIVGGVLAALASFMIFLIRRSAALERQNAASAAPTALSAEPSQAS